MGSRIASAAAPLPWRWHKRPIGILLALVGTYIIALFSIDKAFSLNENVVPPQQANELPEMATLLSLSAENHTLPSQPIVKTVNQSFLMASQEISNNANQSQSTVLPSISSSFSFGSNTTTNNDDPQQPLRPIPEADQILTETTTNSTTSLPIIKNDEPEVLPNHVLRVGTVPSHNRSVALLNPVRLAPRLEFVHIPKSGGTALEVAAAQVGLPWGMCHNQQFKKGALPYRNFKVPLCKVNQELNFSAIQPFGRTPLWHTPPCYFYNQGNRLWYKEPNETALFAIVRNPYDKWVSEFGYFNRKQRKRDPPLDADRMNDWISWTLSKLLGLNAWRQRHLCQRQMNSRYFVFFGGHVIPQYDFVFGTATRFEERVIPHVLYYETLTKDLATLLQVYNVSYSLTLPPKPRTLSRAYSAANLTRDNLDKINELYRDDFVAFGYEMR